MLGRVNARGYLKPGHGDNFQFSPEDDK